MDLYTSLLVSSFFLIYLSLAVRKLEMCTFSNKRLIVLSNCPRISIDQLKHYNPVEIVI